MLRRYSIKIFLKNQNDAFTGNLFKLDCLTSYIAKCDGDDDDDNDDDECLFIFTGDDEDDDVGDEDGDGA